MPCTRNRAERPPHGLKAAAHTRYALLLFLLFAVLPCRCSVDSWPPFSCFSAKNSVTGADAGYDDIREDITDKQLYNMSPAELDRYLSYLHRAEPDLLERIIVLALRQTGQEHGVGTLGEYPVDGLSDAPMVDLETSDCVTFLEQTLAMALSGSWRQFFILLQRIRYSGGVVAWETRNHFIEADWQKNNNWLVRDVNEGLGKNLLEYFDMEIERDKFFAANGRSNPFPPESTRLSYFPVERIPDVLGKLSSGMIFMMIRSNYTGKKWVGHLGFIQVENSKVYMVHSRTPEVRRDLFLDYMNDQLGKNPQRIRENRPYVIGFRFLAVRPDPLSALRGIDGPDAPRIIITGKNP